MGVVHQLKFVQARHRCVYVLYLYIFPCQPSREIIPILIRLYAKEMITIPIFASAAKGKMMAAVILKTMHVLQRMEGLLHHDLRSPLIVQANDNKHCGH